mgnify:FL=1
MERVSIFVDREDREVEVWADVEFESDASPHHGVKFCGDGRPEGITDDEAERLLQAAVDKRDASKEGA